MRPALIAIILLFWAYNGVAQTPTIRLAKPFITPIPTAALARAAQLQRQASPQQRAFVDRAVPLASDIAVVRAEAKSTFPGASDSDIETLVFQVMMQASQDADSDLKTAMAEAKGEQNSASSDQQLRLQMLMDRRAKVMEALTTILSRSSQTTETIVKNIK